MPSPELPEDIYRQFSLAEVKAATNNFHQGSIIAEGGFGPVYRGAVNDGTMVVALKRLRSRSLQGVTEFQNEVQLLCQLRHPHLVSFIGFCHEDNEIILVYEYMSRGSLSYHLHRDGYVPLGWKNRLQICIGAARGLHYLHTGVKHVVFHRDIKSSNILLDDEWSGKLSSFGLSKMGPISMKKALIRTESSVVGTFGYLAPEYMIHGLLTEKSDVFSFGVLLFEVLCGRKVCDATLPKNQQYILEWVIESAKEGTNYHVIDPYLKGTIAPECFKQYLEIACSCVHYEGNKRPTIGEVEVMLELALELQKQADSIMESINPHGEYMYEEASFRFSVSDLDLYGYYYGSGC
ncbi:PREDICTED: receptor-like protein kinase FERONIA [Theobroma cacao]|uniref:non-specific serine/threonine protein kinase n=1 Tax=Theobroma cacao TaxID=3641 RepID=A0AB32W947_THECC|nr:PREDICTED: receptor-like protein kinase FERONIA [Theobroma cacao]